MFQIVKTVFRSEQMAGYKLLEDLYGSVTEGSARVKRLRVVQGTIAVSAAAYA